MIRSARYLNPFLDSMESQTLSSKQALRELQSWSAIGAGDATRSDEALFSGRKGFSVKRGEVFSE